MNADNTLTPPTIDAKCEIDVDGKTIDCAGLKFSFNVKKSVIYSTDSFSVKIFNLLPEDAHLLNKSRLNAYNDNTPAYVRLAVKSSFSSAYTPILKRRVFEGNTDMIDNGTTAEISLSGQSGSPFMNAMSNVTMQNRSIKDVVAEIADNMGMESQTITSNNPLDAINQVLNEKKDFFINGQNNHILKSIQSDLHKYGVDVYFEDEKIIMKPRSVTKGIYQLTDEHFSKAPSIRSDRIEVELNNIYPDIGVGNKVEILSEIRPDISRSGSNYYQVVDLEHTGSIDPTSKNDSFTKLSLYNGQFLRNVRS